MAPSATAIGASTQACVPSGGENRHVNARESAFFRFHDRDVGALEADGLAGHCRDIERYERRNREVALFKRLDHFVADCAHGADYGDFVCFH